MVAHQKIQKVNTGTMFDYEKSSCLKVPKDSGEQVIRDEYHELDLPLIVKTSRLTDDKRLCGHLFEQIPVGTANCYNANISTYYCVSRENNQPYLPRNADRFFWPHKICIARNSETAYNHFIVR